VEKSRLGLVLDEVDRIRDLRWNHGSKQSIAHVWGISIIGSPTESSFCGCWTRVTRVTVKTKATRRVLIVQTIVAGKDCDREKSVIGGAGSTGRDRREDKMKLFVFSSTVVHWYNYVLDAANSRLGPCLLVLFRCRLRF
jgi:hypothetical protein